MKYLLIVATLMISNQIFAMDPDWSKDAYIPEGENRANIFNLDESTLDNYRHNGLIHAQKYPVTVTGLLIPYRPLMTFLEATPTNPLKKLIYDLGKEYTGFNSEKDLYAWLGLSQNNNGNETGIYRFPYPNGKKDNFYAGAGIIKQFGAEGLTFSCFTCHAQTLFGKVVVGLTNKRPRANQFFHMARGTVPMIPTSLFIKSTNGTKGDALIFDRTKKNLVSVEALNPQVLGLDTSLSQIALSLARRNPDAYATKSKFYEAYPRPNALSKYVADSKPMPWWNLKYKTRWLSDGSIVQGNPVYTNFLWNEIGRGTDLKELEKWMVDNKQTIDELTAAVFSTEAPRWTDFFDAKTISIEKAKRGEIIFNQNCASCHGVYEKGWSSEVADTLSPAELIKTTKLFYHDKTPVKNVGTDPQRFEGMKYFADALNKLQISKTMNTVVVPQKGYVPPPLDGIFARYPYFHNNSIPNLCALFTPPANRPKEFYQGPSDNIATDYDSTCVGYPVGNKIPFAWKSEVEAKFDTTKPGLSNMGHYSMFLDKNGNELYTAQDKMDMIEFLKTL